MKFRHGLVALAFGLALTGSAQAQTTTATCNDGTTYTGQSHQGACSHHGGVQAWTPPATPGQVWVNTATHVYHCPGDRWYGKTKAGEFMSEVDAKAKGNRPDHGKVCS